MKTIPPEGLRGQRLVEAAAGELRARFDLVRASVAKANGRDWADIVAWYADRVVVFDEGGRLKAYPYTIADDNTVQLGAPEEVVQQHVPVRVVESVDVGRVIEAAADKGEWLIRVIRAGESANGNVYPAAVLREAAPMFEGARVFVKSDDEHIKGSGKDVNKLIGGLTAPRFVEGASPEAGEIQATLRLIEPSRAHRPRPARYRPPCGSSSPRAPSPCASARRTAAGFPASSVSASTPTATRRRSRATASVFAKPRSSRQSIPWI